MHGGALQQQPSPPPPSLPPVPNLAEQATQTNQQTSTYTNFTNQIDSYSDSFYPVFKPTLQSASTHQGTIAFNGLTTSQYFSNDVITNIQDTLTFSINTNNDSISSGTIMLNHEGLDNPIPLSLIKTTNSSTMTYKNSNEFSIKDFDAYKGWLQTENTYVNDYVSWGYWSIKANDDTKLLETRNYWVAGIDADAAHRYIAGKIGNADTPITNYTYNGITINYVLPE
jgi:hypothetical protein